MLSNDYSCDGQITLTDYLKSKIKSGEVKDLTNFINSQGKAQYTQIGEVYTILMNGIKTMKICSTE